MSRQTVDTFEKQRKRIFIKMKHFVNDLVALRVNKYRTRRERLELGLGFERNFKNDMVDVERAANECEHELLCVFEKEGDGGERVAP